jgi:hypothetical protein
MVHFQAALPKQLLDVAVAQGIAQVPRDRLQDQRRLEVPALEVGPVSASKQPSDVGPVCAKVGHGRSRMSVRFQQKCVETR